MKIASWNLNHRSVPKEIPQGILDVIGELSPDILVLTEYVDDASHEGFKDGLTKQGFSKISVSKGSKDHNQVLIASRQGHSLGTPLAPVPDSHAETNYLSVHIAGEDLEIIGLRAPAYEKKSEINAYWTALAQSLEGATDRRALIIGDVNGDPANTRSLGGTHMNAMRERGWMIPVPSGEWSYSSADGVSRSRIDHVLATPGVGDVAASYIIEVGQYVVAGSKGMAPLSDHAVLMAELKSHPGLEAEAPIAAHSETILRIAAEGGGITLIGIRKAGGWVFRRNVRDWTPELLDEEWLAHESMSVDSWEAALDLLDQYPWHVLSPITIHPAFRKAVFDAIEVRYDAGTDPSNDKFAPTGRSKSNYEKWHRLCGETKV
jgi:exonuclease III